MTTKIKTVLFDLDGTILDTNELIMHSFLHALKGYVPEDFGRAQMIASMGLPLAVQMRKFTGLEDVTDIIAAYRGINLELHDAYVRAFPQVKEVVERLHASGMKLGVVTTKIRLTTERGLKLAGLRQYMSAIVTLDDVKHAKPHPEPVLRAMQELNAEPPSTVMIGDSGVDIESALAAGAIPVGVAWSLKGEAVLRTAGARHILQEMRDIYDIVGMEREPLEKG